MASSQACAKGGSAKEGRMASSQACAMGDWAKRVLRSTPTDKATMPRRHCKAVAQETHSAIWEAPPPSPARLSCTCSPPSPAPHLWHDCVDEHQSCQAVVHLLPQREGLRGGAAGGRAGRGAHTGSHGVPREVQPASPGEGAQLEGEVSAATHHHLGKGCGERVRSLRERSVRPPITTWRGMQGDERKGEEKPLRDGAVGGGSTEVRPHPVHVTGYFTFT